MPSLRQRPQGRVSGRVTPIKTLYTKRLMNALSAASEVVGCDMYRVGHLHALSLSLAQLAAHRTNSPTPNTNAGCPRVLRVICVLSGLKKASNGVKQ